MSDQHAPIVGNEAARLELYWIPLGAGTSSLPVRCGTRTPSFPGCSSWPASPGGPDRRQTTAERPAGTPAWWSPAEKSPLGRHRRASPSADPLTSRARLLGALLV